MIVRLPLRLIQNYRAVYILSGTTNFSSICKLSLQGPLISERGQRT